MSEETRAQARQHVLEVAAEVLERDGVAALSTRGVAAAAGLRPAALYQHFGDKDGLLAALGVHAFDRYLAEKQGLHPSGDPVADMRRGWDAHVDFGLRHRALYLLMYGTDRPERRPPAAQAAHELLSSFLHRVAAVGRLRVPPEVAAHLLFAGVTGTTLMLITDPEAEPGASATLRDLLVDSVTIPDSAAPSAAATGSRALAVHALALDAGLSAAAPGSVPLRPTEQALLHDWLGQLAR